ncbi:unnamed protein product [Cylindrotheca closterium]|uniref:Uncharacterized protein n=1 Tax=Cylindrotheca closterium TaxID=2856 RepID=A0AAD2FXV8_9STRA|nr:unnamed protein product [Cylindrotheca closterium]
MCGAPTTTKAAVMTPYQRRRSDASSADHSVISAITMDEEFGSHHSRSLHRFDPKLRSLMEQKRSSDPDEEEVKQCLNELRVPGRNDDRFSSCSEGDKQLCAIPRRRMSVEMELCIKPAQYYSQYDGETKEDDEDDDASQASMETLEGSQYAYDSIEMGFEDEQECVYKVPMKAGEDNPNHEGRPRRNYRRRVRSGTSSVTLWVAASSSVSSDDSPHSPHSEGGRPRRNYRRRVRSSASSVASSIVSDDQSYGYNRISYP